MCQNHILLYLYFYLFFSLPFSMPLFVDDNSIRTKRPNTSNSIKPVKKNKTVHNIPTGITSVTSNALLGTIFTSANSIQLLSQKNAIVAERLSEKTVKKYNCGTMRVINFCIRVEINISDALPSVMDDMFTRERKSRALEQVMSVFASWLVTDQGCQVSTASDYVQDCLAVFAEQLNLNVKSHIWKDWKRTIMALEVLYPHISMAKQPILQQHIEKIRRLPNSILDVVNNTIHRIFFTGLITIWAICARPCDVITDNAKHDPTKNVNRSDITFFPDIHNPVRVEILVRGHKTRNFCARRGVIFKPKVIPIVDNCCFCPVKFLRAMILNDPVPLSEQATTPLFRFPDGKPMTYKQLHSFTKSTMGIIGCNAAEYGCSSLRSGAATAARAIPGVTELQLQNLGYWCSDIFSQYTRITESSVTDLIRQMLEMKNTKALPDIVRYET